MRTRGATCKSGIESPEQSIADDRGDEPAGDGGGPRSLKLGHGLSVKMASDLTGQFGSLPTLRRSGRGGVVFAWASGRNWHLRTRTGFRRRVDIRGAPIAV